MQTPQNILQTQRLLRQLGTPQAGLAFVHIAGTNGKGSTAAFLERMLRAAGYRTGLFTSPHLLRFHERIRVNGEPIDDFALKSALEKVERAEKEANLPENYFRKAMAAALLHFQACGVDCAVMEAGLGGRLDPTNALGDPLLCILTRIGLDHTDVLGENIEEIAAEKAGIIKQGVPVITAPQVAGAMGAVKAACERMQAPLFVTPAFKTRFVAGRWAARYRGMDAPLGLGGLHQGENAALAVRAAACLRTRGFSIRRGHILEGLAQAHWPGRFALLHENPPILFDGAHNPDSVGELVRSLRARFGDTRPVIILGMMKNKPFAKSAGILSGYASALIAVSPPGDRALPAATLHGYIATLHEKTFLAADMQAALALARKLADGAPIVVCGSFYLYAPLLQACETLS